MEENKYSRCRCHGLTCSLIIILYIYHLFNTKYKETHLNNLANRILHMDV
jgi:hypothetical protein